MYICILLLTPKTHQMQQNVVGFQDFQKYVGIQPPLVVSLDRKKLPWGTFPVSPLPCNSPPIVYVREETLSYSLIFFAPIFYIGGAARAASGGHSGVIKCLNSFATTINRPSFKEYKVTRCVLQAISFPK